MGFVNLREARRHMSLKDFRCLHDKAVKAVEDLQISELHLIRTLQIIEEHKVHRWCGYNSLFEYGVQCLGLSRSQSYMYASLSKATKKFKKLEEALNIKRLTASKAARVLSVMNHENEEEWITKAICLPKAQLEKEVVRLNPKKSRGERMEYLTSEVVELKTPISEEVYKMLVKVQDLLSGTMSRAVSMEEVFRQLAKDYLQKKDPLEKAKRQLAKRSQLKAENKKGIEVNSEKNSEKNSEVIINLNIDEIKEVNTDEILGKKKVNQLEISNNFKIMRVGSDHNRANSHCSLSTDHPTLLKTTFSSSHPTNHPTPISFPSSFPSKDKWGQRLPIPQEVVHGVHLRDQRRCRYHYPSGERCQSTRWLHLHHKKPIANGGEHSLENIITLCPAHHELAHYLLENSILDIQPIDKLEVRVE